MDEHEHDLNLLAAFLEDRLDQQERTRLVEHLAECAECRGTLAVMGRAAAAGALLPVAPMPEPAQEPRAWRVPGRLWLPLAASVTIAAAVGLRLLPVTPRTEVSPPSPSAPAAVVDRASPPVAEAAPSPEPMSSPAAGARRSSPPSMVDESLLVKRGGERRVAGKAFRLVAGEWVDVRFDPAAALPIVSVAGSEDRAALLARVPPLAPYAGLGERVLVVFEGTVYRFSP